MAVRVSSDKTMAELPGQLTGYAGEQLPGITPTVGRVSGIGQYVLSAAALGRPNYGPYDRYRGLRPVISQQEHTAGPLGMPAQKRGATFGDNMLSRWRTATGRKFLGWMSNEAGGGIVQRIQFYPQPDTKGRLQSIIESPVVSNVLGRFLRWSDYGVAEANQMLVQENEVEQERSGFYQRRMTQTLGRSIYLQDSYEVRRSLGPDGYPDATQRYANAATALVVNAASNTYTGPITNPRNGENMEFASILSMTPEEQEEYGNVLEFALSAFLELPILSPQEGHTASGAAYPGAGTGEAPSVQAAYPPGSPTPSQYQARPSISLGFDPTPGEPAAVGPNNIAARIRRGVSEGIRLEDIPGVPREALSFVAAVMGRQGEKINGDAYMLAIDPTLTPEGRDFMAVVMTGFLSDGSPTAYDKEVFGQARAINRVLTKRRQELTETARHMFQLMAIADEDDFASRIINPGLAKNRYATFLNEFKDYPDTPEGNLAMRNRYANVTIYLTGGKEQLDGWVQEEDTEGAFGLKWDNARQELGLFDAPSSSEFWRRLQEGQAVWDSTPPAALRQRPDIHLGGSVTDGNRGFVDLTIRSGER